MVGWLFWYPIIRCIVISNWLGLALGREIIFARKIQIFLMGIWVGLDGFSWFGILVWFCFLREKFEKDFNFKFEYENFKLNFKN
jgi:hypothetical protein